MVAFDDDDAVSLISAPVTHDLGLPLQAPIPAPFTPLPLSLGVESADGSVSLADSLADASASSEAALQIFGWLHSGSPASFCSNRQSQEPINMVRPPCCDKLNVKKGPWSAEEDAKILACVSKNGTGNWNDLPKKAGLKRCGKSCRLRWTNYLRPDIKHDNFTAQEEELIISLHAALGSRWSIIAQQLPGRTDNDVKNFWNTKLRKKLCKMGIDHVTHKPFSQILADYGRINSLSNPETRIGSLTRDLKKSYVFKPEAYQFVPKSEYQDSCSSIDLLSQLQAIRLVTEASISRNHLLGEENLSSSSSTSTSSTGSTTAFNWQDFLLFQADQPQPDQVEESLWLNMETSSGYDTSGGQVESTLMLQQSHEEVETGPGFVLPSFDVVEGCSSSVGDGFVEAMLVRENQMLSDFAHLLTDTFDD